VSEFANIILYAGRAGVELAFFVLLPVMIVMLTFMRLLEAKGLLDFVVKIAGPLLRPFGLPGLGAFAMIQILFVSFAAPMATLAMMDKGGSPRRHIAATLAMVLSMAQANVVFPMAALGLHGPLVMIISAVSGLIGAALTYHIFARKLPDRDDENELVVTHKDADGPKGVLDVINKAGSEALKITLTSIPMLVLALVFVAAMREGGIMAYLEELLSPLLNMFDLPASFVIVIITKYIAGGTAMMGVAKDSIDQGLFNIADFNRVSGFLIHPFDIAGVAVIISAGKRVAEVLKPALMGAAIAIILRSVIHGLIF